MINGDDATDNSMKNLTLGPVLSLSFSSVLNQVLQYDIEVLKKISLLPF